MAAHTNHTPTLAEKVRGLAGAHREHIIVEVEKLLIHSLNAMQAHLNGVTVEGGQELGGDDVAVQHHIDLLSINPLGHLALARHNEVYFAHKGHILRYATEQVAQGAPITKTFLQRGDVGVAFIVGLPHRVQPIYVCNDNIHRKCCGFLLFFFLVGGVFSGRQGRLLLLYIEAAAKAVHHLGVVPRQVEAQGEHKNQHLTPHPSPISPRA